MPARSSPLPARPSTRAPHHAEPEASRGLTAELARGTLLVALGAMLLLKVVNGTIAYYVKADQAIIVLLGAVGLLLTGGVVMASWAVTRPAPSAQRPGLTEIVLLAPLAAGLLLPARPLDSSALAQRGLNTIAVPGSEQRLATLPTDTVQWTLLDWALALQRETDPARLNGRPVSLVGFVHGDISALERGEFRIARFVVTCCAADGAAVGLPVRASTPAPQRDRWVRVTGLLEVAPSGERQATIVATTVEPIEPPRTPYLSP